MNVHVYCSESFCDLIFYLVCEISQSSIALTSNGAEVHHGQCIIFCKLLERIINYSYAKMAYNFSSRCVMGEKSPLR